MSCSWCYSAIVKYPCELCQEMFCRNCLLGGDCPDCVRNWLKAKDRERELFPSVVSEGD